MTHWGKDCLFSCWATPTENQFTDVTISCLSRKETNDSNDKQRLGSVFFIVQLSWEGAIVLMSMKMFIIGLVLTVKYEYKVVFDVCKEKSANFQNMAS